MRTFIWFPLVTLILIGGSSRRALPPSWYPFTNLPTGILWYGGPRWGGTVMDTTEPVTTGTTRTATTKTELVNAIATSVGGDEVSVTADIDESGGLTIPARSGFTSVAANGYVKISGNINVPAQGTRVGAATTLRKIRATDSSPVFLTASADGTASGYWVKGLEITSNYTAAPSAGEGLVGFGTADSAQNTLGKTPTHLVLDRCKLQGTASTQLRRGVTLNCKYGAVVDCYITNIGYVGSETQAIWGTNGPGPFKIRNNYLAATGENVFFGGSDPAISGLTPADIEIVYNEITKPDAWNGVLTSAVKNLIELKCGNRVLIYGNSIHGCWQDGQTGYAWVFWNVNQGGANLASLCQDITACYNRVYNIGAWLQLTGWGGETIAGGPTVNARRFHIAHNVVDRINTGIYLGDARAVKYDRQIEDVIYEYNTVFESGLTDCVELASSPGSAIRPRFRYNISHLGTYGVFSSSGAGTAGLAASTTGYTWLNNGLIGTDPTGYPATTNFIADPTAVFTNTATRDYTVKSSASTYWHTAENNASWGADAAAVVAATAGVES